MNAFNNSGKVEEFKPIIILDTGEYIVNFNKTILTEEEKVLKKSRYVSTGKRIPTGNAIWQSIIFKKKPSLLMIEETIFDIINKATEKRIVNNFKWKGYSVHLDKENQMNYKNAFDLALATNGENLPVTFKFKLNGESAYYTFDTIDELKDFYLAVSNHITKCLEAGWKEKDKFDRNDYKI